MDKGKFQFIFILVVVSLSLIRLSFEYDVSRFNHRFDSKKLVTPDQMTDTDLAMAELTKLEYKLANKLFDEKDLSKLYRLMEMVNNIGSRLNTPAVYWYSRQGRK